MSINVLQYIQDYPLSLALIRPRLAGLGAVVNLRGHLAPDICDDCEGNRDNDKKSEQEEQKCPSKIAMHPPIIPPFKAFLLITISRPALYISFVNFKITVLKLRFGSLYISSLTHHRLLGKESRSHFLES